MAKEAIYRYYRHCDKIFDKMDISVSDIWAPAILSIRSVNIEGLYPFRKLNKNIVE